MTEFERCWRYHATLPAKIIETQAEYDQAELDGWRKSPEAALEAVDIDGAMPDDGVIATLEAAEAAVEQGETGEIEEALEAAEEAIEEVQKVVAKKRKR